MNPNDSGQDWLRSVRWTASNQRLHPTSRQTCHPRPVVAHRTLMGHVSPPLAWTSAKRACNSFGS
eukprot:7935950-Alexandrium_andersonii.AAC.1